MMLAIYIYERCPVIQDFYTDMASINYKVYNGLFIVIWHRIVSYCIALYRIENKLYTAWHKRPTD